MLRSAPRWFRTLLLAAIAGHGLTAPPPAAAQSCTGPLSGLWVLLAAAPTVLSCSLIDCDSECRCRVLSGSTPIPLGGGITIPVTTPICHDGGTLFGQDTQSGVTNTLSGTVEPSGRAGIVDDLVQLTQVTRGTASTGTLTTTVSATGMVVQPGLFGMPLGVSGDWQRHDEFVDTANRCVAGPLETCTASGRFNTLIVRSAVGGLSITKHDLPDPVLVGDDLTYSLTVKNNGQTTATGVVLKDNLPDVTFVSVTSTQGSCSGGGQSITCDLGTLAGGATATVTIVVRPLKEGTICNTASVMGNEPDPNPADNTATECTTVDASVLPPAGAADLSLTKTHGPEPVPVQGCLTYRLQITNRGPGMATGVIVTDTLPDSVRFVSATPSQGQCTSAGRVVTCNLSSIPNQAGASVTIVVEPTTASEITNTAIVRGNEPDPDPGNNTATVTTTVAFTSQAPQLEITLSQRSVRPGDTFIAESRVVNPGPSFTADFYFAALLGDQTLLFLTPTGTAIGRPSDACTFRPRFPGIVIPHTCTATVIDRLSFVVTGGQPAGSHLLVSALTKPNAFADCRVDPGDVIAIAVEPFSIAP